MSLEQMLLRVCKLDGDKSFYHGGIPALTEVDKYPQCQAGKLFRYIPAKENVVPLHISSRHSTYELLGCSSNKEVGPGHVICGFHKTKLSSLFQATRMEAWPHQCGGGSYLDVGNGILVDFALCGGTCSHKGNIGTNWYLHFQHAHDYLGPDEVVVQLWVSESTKLKGGQWGRYCSTCEPGHRNDKVSIAGIHIPVALLDSTTQKRKFGDTLSAPPSAPMPPLPPTTPFTRTASLEIGEEAIVVWPYSGKECALSKQGHEQGYLQVDVGEQVTIVSHAESGHATNAFPSYVYCKSRLAKESHGWLPRLILHRTGCGAFGVASGLTR